CWWRSPRVSSRPSEARSGTHSHSTSFWRRAGATAYQSSQHQWLWVPAFAGTKAGLVPKMPRAGEHHGNAVLVGGLDHLVVAHGAAGLNDSSGAGLDAGQ